MSTKKVLIEGVGEVLISKRKGQHNIRISISGPVIKVTQPYLLPFAAGESFLKSRTSWITEHLKPAKTYVSGQKLTDTISLLFRRSERTSIGSKLFDTSLVVLLPKGNYPEDPDVQTYIDKKLVSLLRSRAESFLPGRVAELASLFGFTYKSVQVKQLKRRWGSCNSKKELVFNLNLVSLDSLHIDYVILHELTHTIHMNHGEKFWAHLEAVFPGCKKVAKVVRRYNV